jgi:hypothetical protein
MANLQYEKGYCGNNLEFVDELIGNMVNVIIQYGSNDFWKLLKYPTKDSPSKPNVTQEERIQLVQDGLVKRVAYNNDISTSAHNEIRIFPYRWDGEGLDSYEIRIGFDIITHNSIIELTNGKTSGMTMVHEMLELFNGAKVGKSVDKLIVDSLSGGITYYNSEYQGYRFYIKGKS